MSAINRTSRSLAAATLMSLSAGIGYAAPQWDLDKCVTLGACSDQNGSGVTVTVKGYDTTSASDTFNPASFNSGSTWIGIKSSGEGAGSPDHAIDNYGTGAAYGELVHLKFSSAVDLTQVIASWVNDTSGNADFRVFRWNFNASTPDPTIGSTAANQLPSTINDDLGGWRLVASGDFESGGTTQSIGDGVYNSSHWLIATAFGGGNDAFKLGMVKATSACAGGNGTGGACSGQSNGTPEPMSLALFGIAALGAGAARRRAAAKRV